MDHEVLTFQGATGYFGPDFVAVSKRIKHYKELYEMQKIPELLLKERYSAVVLDYHIFYYFYRLNDRQRDVTVFTAHDLIPSVQAGVGFHSKKLRDQFNIQLKKYRQQKKHLKVFEKYIGKVKK